MRIRSSSFLRTMFEDFDEVVVVQSANLSCRVRCWRSQCARYALIKTKKLLFDQMILRALCYGDFSLYESIYSATEYDSSLRPSWIICSVKVF